MDFDPNVLDRHFADFICRQAGEQAPPWLWCAVSLLSSAVGNGHICIRMADLAGATLPVGGTEQTFPSLDDLGQALEATPVVGTPGMFRPLIIDADGRLYLYRYWKYEQELGRVILQMAATGCELDEGLLGDGLRRFFPATCLEGTDWQKVAAVAAVRKRFCVISGGPGTGKTSTVIKIIALLAEQAAGTPLRIALAAPTGKSAARLKESVCSMREQLECAEVVRDLIPGGVSTIHRLLGARGTSVRFRHSEENLLPYDVVIVDEASMVALPLMAKLAVALKPEARLILLGDRDQLSSVEAGAVLGDICGRGRQERFSPGFADALARVAGERLPAELIGGCSGPLGDSLVILRKNYRFDAESGIGMVAGSINAGNGAAALAQLGQDGSGRTGWRPLPGIDGLKKALAGKVTAGYESYLAAGSPEEALKGFDAFRVLCALRRGVYGVAGINILIEEILAEEGLIDLRNRWYRGRPLMVTVNDYNLKLFNGDVGIVLPDEDAGGASKVCFPAPEGGIRKIAPVRLPAHETVFAMTVHKSQGSEFDRVLLLLPDREAEHLTRELVYTGVTRARREVEVWGNEAAFLAAVRKRSERNSGLEEILWRERESEHPVNQD